MKSDRKITILLPDELIERATEASGEGLTPTIRKGLELIAAKSAYKNLIKYKGKVDLGLDLQESRKERK